MPTILARRRRSTLIPDEEGCRDHMDFELGSPVDSDSDRNSTLSSSALTSSTLSSLHSTPIPSSAPSPSPSPAPSATSTFSEQGGRPGSSGQGPCHDQQHRDGCSSAQDDGPFVLREHPAVVFASDRLSDKTIIERFHTVNVFDFDQTLFQSPLPNPALWDPSFIGVLTSWNYCGTGWWHNPGTLELGPETEASCWEGWWNEEIVTKVKESSADPGCLTVLLTGRNGPTFGQKLIQMVTAKRLDFDLIATKPTTVARIPTSTTPIPINVNSSTQSLTPSTPPAKSSRKQDKHSAEKYLKVHTFNTKHDFLYNLLFEYPKIRTMHLWDDRPCQVSKFRQAGQEWLDKKMLDRFEITVVQEPMLYMDPQLETDLVLAMVDANNQQVETEQAGGPFLVPGVGLCPRTRPELKDRAIWDPYETYVPQKRLRIDINTIVRYTGIMFSERVQDVMKDIFLGSLDSTTLTSTGDSLDDRSLQRQPWIERPLKLRRRDLSKWVVPDDLHVTFCLGASNPEHLEAIGGLGATALVEVEATGEFEDRIWALKVKEHNLEGHENTRSSGDDQQVLYLAPNGKIYQDLSSLETEYPPGSQHSEPQPSVDQQTASELNRKDEVRHQHQQDLSAVTQSLEKVDLTRLGHVVVKKKEGAPHVTMVYDRLNGTRAVDSGKIEIWESLERRETFTPLGPSLPDGPFRLVLIGTVAQKKLLGMKAKTPGAVQTKAEVSLANVIKSCSGDSTIASGKELGQMVKAVKEEMERMGVENRLANEERIATIAQEVCDRAVNMKLAGQGPSSSKETLGKVTQNQVGHAPPPPIVFQAAE